MTGKKRLDRKGRAAAVHPAVMPGDTTLTAAAVAQEFPKIVLRGAFCRSAG